MGAGRVVMNGELYTNLNPGKVAILARLIVVLMLSVLSLAVLAADRSATVTVSPDRIVGAVNPLIFGNNMLAYAGRRDIYGNRGAGIWDPEQRRPVPEYVALSKLAGVSIHRWPGGCGAHNYNWKRTVGPLADRPDQQFGLPEFMAFCEATDAVAVLTIAVYWGDENDGADLVEYLNAPNDGSNPSGGVDWAAIRAADGHPDPYGVVWFEYGNESYHGEHKSAAIPEPRKFSAEEYSRRALKYRAAMKAVDPNIKLGLLLQNGLDDWNRTVLEQCGAVMDFGIEHTYTPGHGGDTDDSSTRPFMQACTASDLRIQSIYDRLLGLIEEITGRTDVPLAITEYNGHFVQSKPIPYRQTLANALRNAEHLRIMTRPRNRIAMANFWQFANEYWGMVQGYIHQGKTPVKQANFYTYELYAQHFGDTLIEVEVDCDTWDFGGGAWLGKRTGEPTAFKLYDGNLLPDDYVWEDRTPLEGIKQTIDGKVAAAEFPGRDVNYYFPRLEIPVEASTSYRLTGHVKTESLTGNRGAGFQVGDARGWTVTHSCSLEGDVRGTRDWTRVEVDYTTLPDAKAIEILARRVEGQGPVSGKAWFRLESVQRFDAENPGGVPDLGVNAATRPDGTVTVIIVNKNIDEAVATSVSIKGRAARTGDANAWLLSGPLPWSTNLQDPATIGVSQVEVDTRGAAYYLELPACSMAALEIAP